MSWLKSVGAFVLMLVLFAAGLVVVSVSEGGASWLEIALVTLGFGAWWLWKRNRRRAQPGRARNHGAA